jgi:regulator of nucleoside diphosphate kinase
MSMEHPATRLIRVTRADLERLERVIEARRSGFQHDQAHLEALEEELGRAEVVDAAEIPPDVVTMRSRVRVKDLKSGEETVYTLVFPGEASVSLGRLSILAPIGTALLGYRQGDVVEWPVPGGMRRLQVAEVLYQPEAAGQRASA